MSIGTTYVRAVDGNFYADPVLRGPDWFVCFDEDDPPEIVIAGRKRIPAHRRAIEVLKQLGISNKATFTGMGGRCFGNKVRDACEFNFKLKGRIPVPKNQQPKTGKLGEGTYYDPTIIV